MTKQTTHDVNLSVHADYAETETSNDAGLKNEQLTEVRKCLACRLFLRRVPGEPETQEELC